MTDMASGESVASSSTSGRSPAGSDTSQCWLKAVTDEDWALYKDLITRLYLCEQKPLKHVMSILERDHGFKASTNMYKKRISKWGLDKRLKDHESQAIMYTHLQRAAIGKASLFQRRGRVIDVEAVRRSIKRKGLKLEGVEASQISLPPDITCTTPPIVTVARPSAPFELDCQQRVGTLLETYMIGSLNAHTWVAGTNGDECMSSKPHGRNLDTLTQFYDNCNTGCLLFARRTVADNEKGRTLLAKACRLVPQILQTEHPRTLEYLLDIIIYILRRWHCAEVAPLMLRHFSEMADVFLPTAHPLGRICRELLGDGRHSLLHVAIASYRILADLFKRLLGPFHPSTIQCRRLLIHRVDTSVNAVLAEERLRGLLASCEQELGPTDDRCVDLRYTLAQSLRQQRRHVDVELEATKLIRQAQWITSSTRKRADRLCDGYDILSRAQLQLHKFDCATENLRRAVEVSAAERGFNDIMTVSYVKRLEAWRAAHESKQGTSSSPAVALGDEGTGVNGTLQTAATSAGRLDVHLKDRPCDCDELTLTYVLA